MIKSEKITLFHYYLPIYLGMITTGILTMPTMLYKAAEQNLWLPLIVSSLAGYVMVLVVTYLYHRFPGQTLIEIFRTTMGRWIGNFCSALLLGLLIGQAIFILREYQMYLTINYYQYMPAVVVIGLLLLVCMYAVHQGLEVICRSSVFFFPFIIAVQLITCLLILPELSPYRLLPILDKGILYPLKGAVFSFAWYSEFLWGAFYMPAVSVPAKKMLTTGFLFVTATTVSLLIVFFVVICFLGDATSQYLYSFDIVERYIQVSGLIERSSALFMIVWLLGVFVKMALLMFIISVNTAHFVKKISYAKLALPVMLLLLLISSFCFTSMKSMYQNGMFFLNICCLVGNMILPILLLIYCLLFHRDTPRSSGQ